MEERFYGHPLSQADYLLSVSLETNIISPNSSTHCRGFIGLAPHTAASAGEVPPPLHHWNQNELQTIRLEQIFLLCQTLDAEPSVPGVALLWVLLRDFFRTNTEIPYAALKGRAFTGQAEWEPEGGGPVQGAGHQKKLPSTPHVRDSLLAPRQ